MGIWLACEDSWYRDCLVELLRPTSHPVIVAHGVDDAPPSDATLLLTNHDPRVFDLFRWLPKLDGAGARLPVVALFDTADRERAAAAARSLPLFACLIKPIPNEIVALAVRRGLEGVREKAPTLPPSASPGEDRDDARSDGAELRRDVLKVFV